MSGAYVGNLNEVYPGLGQLLGSRENLRGTIPHILEKARQTRERGMHRLSVEQLLLMMSYWEGLALARKEHEPADKVIHFAWYGDRAHPYLHEMFERGVDKPGHPEKTLFGNVIALLYGPHTP
jgi:hypothetical protein